MTVADVQVMIDLINTLDHFGVSRDRYAIQTPPTDACVCLMHINNAWITSVYDHGDMYGMERHDDILDAACGMINMIGADEAEIDAMLEYLDARING